MLRRARGPFLCRDFVGSPSLTSKSLGTSRDGGKPLAGAAVPMEIMGPALYQGGIRLPFYFLACHLPRPPTPVSWADPGQRTGHR